MTKPNTIPFTPLMQPARPYPVRDLHLEPVAVPVQELQSICRAAVADHAARQASDPVQRRLDMEQVAMLCDLCGAEALVTVLELAERHGLASLLTWTKNIAAIQGLKR